MAYSNVAPAFLAAPSLSFSSQFSRRSRPQMRRDDSDTMITSSELELSFASNVSLNSPPLDHADLAPDSDYPTPMDISPMPKNPHFRPTSKKSSTRPRAFTSGARLFGNDVSNKIGTLAPPASQRESSIKSAGSQSGKRMQRAALPTQWFSTVASPQGSDSFSQDMHSLNNFAEPEPEPFSDDAMDVDTSYTAEAAPEVNVEPPASAATVTTFNNLFYESASPPPQQHKKRRSLSPEGTRYSDEPLTSSPGFPPSPSEEKLERISAPLMSAFANKPSLGGLGAPPSFSGLKRPRRPALSAMVHPTDVQEARSTYALPSRNSLVEQKVPAPPPARRAFSALIPSSMAAGNDSGSEDTSFDAGDASSPAQQYAKRQQVKTIRRCDGTDDFRPFTGATAMTINESPNTRLDRAGIPGFAINEAQGKILPCHRVKEDGLMRINATTLNELMDGVYNNDIGSFHIIDCRFDYEYNGGHIPGAVNVNTAQQIEDALLQPSLLRPKPCLSGDGSRKTVLIFHCEFSAKRAPTLATHLRRKDRAVNSIAYPKVHYPEVYILEGGYCQYFKEFGSRCEPPVYVQMDDPSHTSSRREDLDQFRKTKFGRHRSYAYGDGLAKASLGGSGSNSQSTSSKRNTLPVGGSGSLFSAAGSAARTRRATGGLMPLAEDAGSPGDGDETESDIGDSPCPPPTRAAVPRKKPARLARAETYGPSRLPLGIS